MAAGWEAGRGAWLEQSGAGLAELCLSRALELFGASTVYIEEGSPVINSLQDGAS